jgi:hypothetical protein
LPSACITLEMFSTAQVLEVPLWLFEILPRKLVLQLLGSIEAGLVFLESGLDLDGWLRPADSRWEPYPSLRQQLSQQRRRAHCRRSRGANSRSAQLQACHTNRGIRFDVGS